MGGRKKSSPEDAFDFLYQHDAYICMENGEREREKRESHHEKSVFINTLVLFNVCVLCVSILSPMFVQLLLELLQLNPNFSLDFFFS